MKTKINRTSWKSVTLAVTLSLLMSGVASAGPLINISGTVIYCSGNPVPGVTMTLTGGPGGSTTSDGSGNYSFSVPSGGNYTVTPSMADRVPASTGINAVDVLAVAKHIVVIGPPLSGCRLAAADVTGDFLVNIKDVIGMQRFFLGLLTGTAHVGKYQFIPASIPYSNPTSDQTAQDYDALVFGDVTSTFIHRPEGPSQTAASDDMNGDELPAPVSTLSLPNVPVDAFPTDFIAQVTTTATDATNKLVGFEGDFTFDETARKNK